MKRKSDSEGFRSAANDKVIAFYEYLGEHDSTLFDQISDSIVTVVEQEYGLAAVLVVDERTTSSEIRDSIPLALQLRDRVIEWQSYRVPYYVVDLFEMKTHGYSYRAIAEYVNRTIENHLTEIIDKRDLKLQLAKFDADHKHDRHNDFAQVLPPNEVTTWWDVSIHTSVVKAMLQALRFAEDDIDHLVSEWLHLLENDKESFRLSPPISRTKLIAAMKYWQSKARPPVVKTGQV